MKTVDRRWFLRAAGLAAAAAAGACTSGSKPPSSSATTPPPSPSGSNPQPSPSARRAPAWTRLSTDGTPSARRDATLTAHAGSVYLFGGRFGPSKPLADLWVLNVAAGSWKRVDAKGPPARYGHNAGMIGDRLHVFGGQGGPNTFFDDLWVFDPATSAWQRDSRKPAPSPRYGSGDAVVDGHLLVTHGFTNTGRFDDTWDFASAGQGWTDVSPSAGPRPAKRCLHRSIAWSEGGGVALFGGQTTATPFLNDLWVYDRTGRAWRQIRSGASPAPRNLHGLMNIGGRLFVYGGYGPAGELGDTWSLAGPSEPWAPHEFASGAFPLPRGGVATTTMSANESLMFGGRRGDEDLNELWSLRA